MLAALCVLPLLIPGLKTVNSASPENPPFDEGSGLYAAWGVSETSFGTPPYKPFKGGIRILVLAGAAQRPERLS
jgi:hypothetical protein